MYHDTNLWSFKVQLAVWRGARADARRKKSLPQRAQRARRNAEVEEWGDGGEMLNFEFW